MFFRFPIESVITNWVRDWINGTFDANFTLVDAGRRISVSLSSLDETQRERLKKDKDVISAVRKVLVAYKALSPAERQIVRQTFDDQCDVPGILNGTRTSLKRAMLPLPVQEPLDKLSRAAFSALKEFGIRRASLSFHFSDDKGRTCAFCGHEPVPSVDLADTDWDHYLARTHYPFASYDLRNLTPMGVACNRSYKLSKDILRDSGGRRRSCYDPYLHTPVAVHLRNSDPFGNDSRPLWVVTMDGNAACDKTWDDVFRLVQRWQDQLPAKYESCLSDVANAFRRSYVPSDNEFEEVLLSRRGPTPDGRRHGDDIIRHAIFDLWHFYFNVGVGERSRLCELFRDTVSLTGRR